MSISVFERIIRLFLQIFNSNFIKIMNKKVFYSIISLKLIIAKNSNQIIYFIEESCVLNLLINHIGYFFK